MTAATGYSVVLPPSWARIPVRTGAERVLRRLLDDAFRAHPGAGAQHRHELEKRILGLLHEARNNAGLDVYLPMSASATMPLLGSIVVAEAAFGAVEPLDPPLLVAAMSAESANSSVVEVDGSLGVRRARQGEHRADGGSEVAAVRCVDYLLPVPGEPDRWITATFSCPELEVRGSDGALTDVFVELFDAMMTTWRWTRAAA